MRTLTGAVIAVALLTLAACTSSSGPTPATSSPTTTTSASVVTGRNAIEKAVRAYGGVTSVDSEVDYQYNRSYTVEIHVTSNQFFADVANTAVAAATKVKTERPPDITVTTGFGLNKQSLVLDGGTVGLSRLPSRALVARAVALFSDQPLLTYGSGLTVRIHESELSVVVQAELDTAAASVALYRKLLANWQVSDSAVKRLDVGNSFVVMTDIARKTVPKVPTNVLDAWQAEVARSKVVGSTLRSNGPGSIFVDLTISPNDDPFSTGRVWIDALVRLGQPFSVYSTSAPPLTTDFTFDSRVCLANQRPVGVRLYQYYVATYPKQPTASALKSCR